MLRGGRHQFSHPKEILSIQQRLDEGGAEVVGNTAGADQIDGGPDSGRVHPGAAEAVILCERRLDVHGDIIDEAGGDQPFQHLGPAAVGIELYRQAKLFYRTDESGQVVLQSGFAAGDDHAAKLFLAPGQKIQHLAFIQHWPAAALRQQVAVVAKRAAEIAPLGEHYRRNPARIVAKRKTLQPANQHAFSSR